ncbi:MAG: PAS domain S-box protein [Fimbriimonadaceae bacterium]|nr:PAS domain S-box protein [Fimbriimonadaceae bacterium]
MAKRRVLDADQLELMALRTVATAVRDGMSLDGTVSYCLDQTLEHLGLDFGCLYIRRHDYLIRVASRGLSVPGAPGAVLPLTEAAWAQRPFVAQLGDGSGEHGPADLVNKAWLSLPLRIVGELVGVILVGGYGCSPADLPPIEVGRRLAEHIAVAIDNAERFQQLRGILNDTRDVIFRTDAHGRWTYLNAAWEETIGEPVAVALGRRMQLYVAPEQRSRIGQGLEALVPRGSVIGRQTIPFQMADGKLRWMDVQARIVRSDTGQITGAAGVLRDVSVVVRQARELALTNQELRRHTGDLERVNAELAAADRLKSEFLATVSHELRTPLGMVMGYVELLLDGIPDALTSGQREYAEIALEGGRRLERLILQLLELARLEAGRVALDARPTLLLDAVDAARRAVLETAATQQLRVLPVATAVQPLVLAEPDRLVQVAQILLDNAVKFGAAGCQVELAVDLRPGPTPQLNGALPAAGEPRFAQVTVTDHGVGISAERRPLLFRKFVQADGGDTRRHGGLGLGLVIGRALVEMMGGQLDLYSAGEGQGCAAAFTVPLVPAV